MRSNENEMPLETSEAEARPYAAPQTTGLRYSATTFKDNGKPILLNADGTRSIFCDVDDGPDDDDGGQLEDAAQVPAQAQPKSMLPWPGESAEQFSRRMEHIAQLAAAGAWQHPDDVAVDLFATVMKQKLAQARDKGRVGWEQCDPVELSVMLRQHVEKGDPRDVANFCMFLWSLGKPIIAIPAPAVAKEPSSTLVLKYCELTNRTPMGIQTVSSSEGWIESTFYQVAERELQAMFAAQAALAQEGGEQ
ncbi:hypothetical protein [Herbaspirillum seropedicae]|uniref:hypothetical protein n=1 Tax=Herbaspirillum seropedicae TaxID=964 RepID=UPI0015DE593F|nr:hypothetical protein [Herbaspirillum seropedicae]